LNGQEKTRHHNGRSNSPCAFWSPRRTVIDKNLFIAWNFAEHISASADQKPPQ
jgi:hypothetical protein